jgi:hypothetical protein
MDKTEVRLEVENFRVRTAYGNTAADCFPAWYLHQTFQISETKAMTQSAESSSEGHGPRNYDFGIDAYHLEGPEQNPTKLFIIQAKYSDFLSYISKGFKDLEKSLDQLERLLEGVGSDVPMENKVLVNLRAALNVLNAEVKKNLIIEFDVIHISDEDREIISNRVRQNKESLRDAVTNLFPDRKFIIRDIGVRDMGPRQEIVVPSPWIKLHLNASPVQVGLQNHEKMLCGVGYLCELVDLYVNRREALFSKNVRYFINKKRNIERGAAGKMRQTLKEICLNTQNPTEPEIFAFYHNGITITAKDIESADATIRVRDPYVLNGCQTIKNAYLFRYDPKLENRIDADLWKRILVPLRVVIATNDELIRSVTVNNNRQNQISAAALRANDRVSIMLEERFKKAGIFYERQEGAYESVEDSNPEIIEEEYANTRGKAVNIVDLARSIAAAAGEISYAKHPSDLFEIDTEYNRCFSDKRLASITFLTFLQNLHDVIFVILKNDLRLSQRGDGPKPSALGYYTMCLLARYIAKKRMDEDVIEFGSQLWGRHWQFRDKITELLSNKHSGIKTVLRKVFLPLPDATTDSLNGAFSRAESRLRLKNVDVFDTFKNLDRLSNDANQQSS